MKFTCEKSVLQEAVNISSQTVSPKSTLAALEGLLLEAGSDLHITGYDLKTGIRTVVSADVSVPGSIVLNSRLFVDIIRKLPDDIISIECGDNYMTTITCGMSKFNIMGINPADFPEMPSVESQSSVYILEKTLKNMISQTNFSVSTNDARPIHTGSLFDIEGGMLTLVSVDGYRLALRKEHLAASDLEKCSFVVPGTALNQVERIASEKSEEAVKITLGLKHIMFTIGNTVLVSRRLEGEFLNYKNAIPKTFKHKVEVYRSDFIASVDRVSLIINDKNKSPVRCRFGDGVLKMSASTPLGSAADECNIKGNGEGLIIGFNNRYMMEAAKAAPADEFSVKLNSGLSPAVIVPVDGGESFLYMILPVRLTSYED
ncbi:MAG: DNA polymerase III subunit beta [Ruminococcaceae bacterium]|nr:DNA polymerase III subunit beta [Oscillospiraceae bacterium]